MRELLTGSGQRVRPDRLIARFAWGLLAYDVAVVLWGAYVRATGSGAPARGRLVPR